VRLARDRRLFAPTAAGLVERIAEGRGERDVALEAGDQVGEDGVRVADGRTAGGDRRVHRRRSYPIGASR